MARVLEKQTVMISGATFNSELFYELFFGWGRQWEKRDTVFNRLDRGHKHPRRARSEDAGKV